jgi:membrane-associated phospholipid phosphatase
MPIVLITATLLGIALAAAIATFHTRERFQTARDRVAAGFRKGLRRLIGRFERVLPWWGAATAATVTLLLGALALTWVIGMALAAASQDTGAAWIDLDVAFLFAENRSVALTSFYRTATFLGDTSFIFPFVAVFGLAWRKIRGNWLGLVAMGGTYLGASAMYNAGKLLVARPRPAEGLRIDSHAGYSFPSGHTAQSFAFYIMLALVLLSIIEGWLYRVAVTFLAVTMATLVGVSRVYLGAHWLSDIIAGALLGAGWAILLWLLIEAAEQRRGRPLEEKVAPSPAEDLAASES